MAKDLFVLHFSFTLGRPILHCLLCPIVVAGFEFFPGFLRILPGGQQFPKRSGIKQNPVVTVSEVAGRSVMRFFETLRKFLHVIEHAGHHCEISFPLARRSRVSPERVFGLRSFIRPLSQLILTWTNWSLTRNSVSLLNFS